MGSVVPAKARWSRGAYTAEAVIGAGAFGQVERVHDEAGDLFARKRFPLTEDGLRKDAIAEIAAYALTSGVPGVIHFRAVELEEGSVAIISDLYEGTVAGLVVQEEDRVELADRVFRAVMVALRAMHARGVMHLDVKPANILYRGEEIALGDLGLAYFTSCSGSVRHKLRRGSRRYLAPESDEGVSCKESDYASAALSCLAVLTAQARSYASLAGEYPHAAEDGVSVMAYLVRERPLLVERVFLAAPHLVPALELCLRRDPARRRGAQLDMYLGESEPDPCREAPPSPDENFEQLVRWYRSLGCWSERVPEAATAFGKLLSLAWILYSRGVTDETAYRALCLVVCKLYLSGREIRRVLFPGVSGEEVARRELEVMGLVGSGAH